MYLPYHTNPQPPTPALQGVSSSNAALLMKPSPASAPAPAPPVSVSGGNQPQPHICHQNEGLASLGCFVNGRRDMPKHLKKKNDAVLKRIIDYNYSYFWCYYSVMIYSAMNNKSVRFIFSQWTTNFFCVHNCNFAVTRDRKDIC